MTRKLTILSALALAVWPLCAAVSPEKAANTVILTPDGVKSLGIETVEAEETTFEETFFALGRIKVAPGHRAVVSSRVPGRVLTLNAHLDTPVQKGAEVAVIESRQPGDPPPSVRLVAPISGLVSEMNAAVGQPVDPSTSIMEIVDLTEVHAVAAVPDHLVGKIKVGQKARVSVAAVPGQVFEATLAHLGAQADAESNTLEAAFHLANPDGLLRPGMRAEFSIVLGQREGVMSIPRETIQGDAAGRFVYIKDYELKDAFVKTAVQLGAQNDRFVEVTGGLIAGDEVVTRGAYSLAFAGKGSVSLKEALDAAHGHPHNDDGSEMTKEQQEAAKARGGPGSVAGGKQGPLTAFLIATNVLLLLLLVVSVALRRKPATA